jgi:hypothetical protein
MATVTANRAVKRLGKQILEDTKIDRTKVQ